MERVQASKEEILPKYPFATMKELRQHAEQNQLTIAQVILANEMAISGRSQEEVYAFIDKITNAMVAIVKSGLSAPEGVLPGPIKLKTKAGNCIRTRPWMKSNVADRGIGALSAYALAGSEENGRGHLVRHRADRRFCWSDASAGIWLGRRRAKA